MLLIKRASRNIWVSDTPHRFVINYFLENFLSLEWIIMANTSNIWHRIYTVLLNDTHRSTPLSHLKHRFDGQGIAVFNYYVPWFSLNPHRRLHYHRRCLSEAKTIAKHTNHLLNPLCGRLAFTRRKLHNPQSKLSRMIMLDKALLIGSVTIIRINICWHHWHK